MERYTTRQMQPMSKQGPAQVKTDNETVLDVEMCGAVRWCAVVVLEGELRRGRWASNGGAAGGGGESKRVFRRARRMRKSDGGRDGQCDIATAAGEERAMAGRRGEVREECVCVYA